MSAAILPLRSGHITLVGAGPGHPDFLTLRGLRALQGAEVILADALLDPAFEALYPEDAEVRFVGKRCGRHAMPQAEINALLVSLGLQGRRVVRLKGGDPFVFGRGGEEALALREAGLSFEVVPGLSALTGVAGAAGIPLTHRGLAHEVRVIEGHSPRTEAEWADLAAFRGTLAVFMGTRTLPEMAQALLRHGADPAWPLALMESGCTERQRVQRGCLRDAAEGRMRCQTGPGLVLLGPTVPLHDLLSTPLSFPGSHVHAASPLPEPQRPARPARGRRERRAG